MAGGQRRGHRQPVRPDEASARAGAADAGAHRQPLTACKGSEFTERRDTALGRLLIDSGIRSSELLGLAVDDLDFEPGIPCPSRVPRVVSRGECITGLTWDPREGSRRPNRGQARGLPDARPAYEPSPQVKPLMHSPSEAKGSCVAGQPIGRLVGRAGRCCCYAGRERRPGEAV